MGVRLTKADYNADTDRGAVSLGTDWQSYRSFWAAVLQRADADFADTVHFRLERGAACLALESDGKSYLLTPPPPAWRPFVLAAARKMATGGAIRSAIRAPWRLLSRSNYLGTIHQETLLGDAVWRVEAHFDGLTMRQVYPTAAEHHARESKCKRLARKWSKAVHASRTTKADAAARKIADLYEPVGGKESGLSFAMSMIAGECEEMADWKGADIAYQKKLALDEKDGLGTYSAHSDLSALYYLLGREEEGMKHRQLATSTARDDDGIILLLALLEEASDHLYHKDLAAANAMLPEISRVLEAETDSDFELPQFHAKALNLQAAGHFEAGDLDAAASDLQRAFELLEAANQPCDGDIGPGCGLEADLARCWKLQARLETHRGNLDEAGQSWSNAINHARRVASGMDTCYCKRFLALTLREAADSIEESGRRERVAEYRDEAQQIWDALRLPEKE